MKSGAYCSTAKNPWMTVISSGGRSLFMVRQSKERSGFQLRVS